MEISQPEQLGDVGGYFYARFVNRRDGNAVVVFLVGGPPGPVAIHTPDVCYQASGYEVRAQERVTVGDPRRAGGEFWSADLIKNRTALENRLHILWSWSATGAWSVPDSPRLTFARCPLLYKLYVLGDRPESESAATARVFVSEFLPQLQMTLFNQT
jgi:hypothetical protein